MFCVSEGLGFSGCFVMRVLETVSMPLCQSCQAFDFQRFKENSDGLRGRSLGAKLSSASKCCEFGEILKEHGKILASRHIVATMTRTAAGCM